jgi:tripartite-type tricarboxylate transporter receptor subunit TctC
MRPARANWLLGVTVLGGILSAFFNIDKVAAQSAEVFYRTHPISLVVGYSSGSAYDVLGHAMAKVLGRHILGNPAVIVVNQPGAGSLSAANYLYNVAKNDGSEIGTFSRGIPMEPLIGDLLAKYDATRFTWLGSVASETSVCASWHTSPIKTWDDLFTHEFVAGANSPSSDTGIFANLIKSVFGANIKLIVGYPGGADINKAIESGEIDGRCGWSWSAVKSSEPSWLADKLINVFVQLDLHKSPELPDVPLIVDFAKTERQMQILKLILRRQDIAWPFAAPPGIPEDRKAALRVAFDATMRDPEFVAEARMLQLEVNPISGAAVEASIQEMYRSPSDVVTEVKRLLNSE